MVEDENKIERTTISLTAYQMREMKKRLDHGMFPDMTEGIRMAVLEFIERHPNNPAETPASPSCAPVVVAS